MELIIKKFMKITEHEEQSIIIEWFRITYPRYSNFLFSIPNGTYFGKERIKGIYQMKRLKKEGFKKGVSDLFLMIPILKYHGLFLEVKKSGATLSSLTVDQKKHLVDAMKMSYAADWCAGSYKGIEIITDYLNGNYSVIDNYLQ